MSTRTKMNLKKTRRMPLLTFQEHKHILTNEEWHPTVDGKVRVSLIGWDDRTWRVCVWGGDDFGMELDLGDRHQARQIFNRIVNLTTMAEMNAMGLGPA